MASLSRRAKYLVVSGAALSLSAVGVPSILWHTGSFLLMGVRVSEVTLIASAAILAVATFLFVAGIVIWWRSPDAPPLIPLRTRWHYLPGPLFILVCVTMSTRVECFAYDDGYVEEILGWPVPVAERSAGYSGTPDNPEFCCSVGGGFSLDHFRAHRELYRPGPEQVTWRIMWPFAVANALFVLIGAFSITHGLDLLLRRFGGDRTARGGAANAGDGPASGA